MLKICRVLLLFAFPAYAQVGGTVVDGETNEPIHYANVWNNDASAGATTNVEGTFEVKKAVENDVFIVNASGYETLLTKALEGDTIRLVKNHVMTDDLIVYPEKTLHHTIGDAHYENLYFNPGNIPWIYAKFFENTSEIRHVQYLSKAIVYTKSIVNDATFKLRIMKPDADGCPGEDLIVEPIIVHVKRGNKKNIVDLLSYNVKMPEKGVFIGVEWLMTDNNRLKTMTYVKGQELFEDYRYAPDLISNTVEKSSAFRYMFGDWFSNEQFIQQKEPLKEIKTYIDPAIGLILSN